MKNDPAKDRDRLEALCRQLVANHMRLANPAGWDGTGPAPEGFDPNTATYRITPEGALHAVDLDIRLYVHKTEGPLHFCRMLIDSVPADANEGYGIDSPQNVLDTVLAVLAPCCDPGHGYVFVPEAPQGRWKSVEDAIAIRAGKLLHVCTDDYASRIWDVIGTEAVADVMECTNNAKDGYTDGDVALAIGRAIAKRLGIEV